MKHFAAVDSFEISGRKGRVYTGPNPFTANENARKQVGTVIEINGQPYIIRAVETFAIISPPGLGDSVGFLVEPFTPQSPFA